jgi:hypothetical protein
MTTRVGGDDILGESGIRLPSIFSLAAVGPRWRGLLWPFRHFDDKCDVEEGRSLADTYCRAPGVRGLGQG